MTGTWNLGKWSRSLSKHIMGRVKSSQHLVNVIKAVAKDVNSQKGGVSG